MLVAMTVAGSDSAGGAGIEADIKAFASLGVHGAVAITCVTAQNTHRVSAIYPLPPSQIISQIDAVLEDMHVSAAKTGMLYSAPIATAVAKRLSHEGFPLVVDPILVAGVGDPLSQEDLVSALLSDLVPIATVFTPNRPEAEVLVGSPIRSKEDVREACSRLADLGAEAVLIKGGHFEAETAVDTLYSEGKFLELESPRVEARGHGGGCIISSYLAANLAHGMDIKEAAMASKSAIYEAIVGQYQIGDGISIVDPLAMTRKAALRYEVMVRLRRAAEDLATILPRSWVPEVGINFVYALPNAIGVDQVCGLEGRIIGFRDGAMMTGGTAFGASKHVATIALTAMKHDGEMRSALNLRFTEEHVSSFQKAGFTVGSFDRKDEPKQKRTTEWGTGEAISAVGFVPDIVFDRGGVGKEPMLRVLGRSPEEILLKVDLVVR
jgi:hydroxymethylpyrimidine kinase/phosphomethylpyrimidine kinase